jgi:hypothetical protein
MLNQPALTDDDVVYTAAMRRQADLRAHPDVQAILAAAATATRDQLRRLHAAWLNQQSYARVPHTATWHTFVKAVGDGSWRGVLMLGEEAAAIIRDHPDGFWGAGHAVADAVKAVHMADHVTADELYVYTRPWNTVMTETKAG